MSDLKLGLSATPRQLGTLFSNIVECCQMLPSASNDEASLRLLENRIYQEGILSVCDCYLVSKVQLVSPRQARPDHIESTIHEVLTKTCFWYNGRIDVCGACMPVSAGSDYRLSRLAHVLRYEVVLRHLGVLVNLYEELGGRDHARLSLHQASSIGGAPSSCYFRWAEGMEELKGMQTAEESARIATTISQLATGERLTIGRSEKPLDGTTHLSLETSTADCDDEQPEAYWTELRERRFFGISRYHCLIESLGNGWYWLSAARPESSPTNGLFLAEPGHRWREIRGIEIVQGGTLVGLGRDFVFKIPL